ncbi:MAG TPA: trypsin-like peptidase domain-containing protein [Candidatus Paceibacterota bacterium]|nr:trypsin-like peptidase domain-containing protein [Candidatus Paceibacterota bacterium]
MADEQRVIETIKRVMPSVVSIMISKHLEDLEKEMPHEFYSFLPGHHKAKKKKVPLKVPDFLVDESGMVSVGGGSGFSVAPGLILTNKHVISDPKAEYTVLTNDGRKMEATVLSRDPVNDVAILKIPADNLPIVPMGDATKLQLGQSVISIGNALGVFKNTVSLGIVSGLSRAISAQADPKSKPQEMRGLIQTDAAVNVGNSGGPLVNLDGQAVGINTAIVAGAQSIGFAIPVNAAKRDLSDIERFGRIHRPFLGIRYIMIDEKLKQKMKLPVAHGALLTPEGPQDPAVVAESPAEKAGLQEKDIILDVNGQNVGEGEKAIIQDFLDLLDPGDVLDMRILRDGKEMRLKVPLGERLSS